MSTLSPCFDALDRVSIICRHLSTYGANLFQTELEGVGVKLALASGRHGAELVEPTCLPFADLHEGQPQGVFLG